MKTDDIDLHLGRLQKVGIAGGLPRDANQQEINDQLQRQIAVLKDAIVALLSDKRSGPGFMLGDDQFTIDARPGYSSYNILTTAEADAAGFGAIEGLAIYRHAKGRRLEFYVPVFFAMNAAREYDEAAGTSALADQPERVGYFIVHSYDDNRTVFQLDYEALTQQAVIKLACWSRSVVPSAANKARAQNTGASKPHLAVTSAGSVPAAELN